MNKVEVRKIFRDYAILHNTAIITRLYSKKFIIMSAIFIAGTLCKEDLEGIKEWTLTLTSDDAKMLTDAGKEEHKQLGERWKKRLPTIFGKSYKDDDDKV